MLTKPTLHINGSSAADLLDGYAAQLAALRKAQTALQQHGPNARDYYVNPDEQAFSRASKEHADRVHGIQRIMDEIDSLAIAVDRQMIEREARRSRPVTAE